MKTFIRAIVALVVLNLVMGCSALAQSVSEREKTKTAKEDMEYEEMAERAAENAEAMAERIAEDIERRVENIVVPQIRVQTTGRPLPFTGWHGGSGRILVVPTSEMKTEDLVTIVEDMTVMASIIDKQLEPEGSSIFMFYGDFLGQSSRAETIYLQGYGALFLKKVDFPLAPTPTVQEEEQAKEEPKEHIDELWKETRQELYEPQEGRRDVDERSEEKYDAEKVENLKATLIKSLKHATNIRGLKPDESVILAVTGGGDSSKVNIIGVSTGKRAGAGTRKISKVNQSLVLPGVPSDSGFRSPTVLVIRAKKSDIDAFAKGKMDFDKFRQKVQIFTQ